MKSVAIRLFAPLMVLVAVALLSGAAKVATTAPVLEQDKLIILSTTDVKGKTSPCG